MSRRSFPRIDPEALRDHADEARIDRVWERVERDLAARPRGLDAGPRRASLAYVAIAASFCAFGTGVLVGKVAFRNRAPADALVVTPVIEKSEVEVLAAGKMPRTFALPGGGSITLEAEATAEQERAGNDLTLNLLQGNASIDTAGHKVLAVVVGETQLSAPGGSRFSVKRNVEDLDVRVEVGSVAVSSPAGAQKLVVGEHAAVPIHSAIAASAAPNMKPQRSPVAVLPRPRPATPKGPTQPEWLARHIANDDDGAFTLLRKQDVGALIASSKNASDLNAIAEILRNGHDSAGEIRACERLVQNFPRDQYATLAADRLAKVYASKGDAERAQFYRDKQVTLAKNAKTGSGSLLCDLIRREPEKTKAAIEAKEYLDKYPDGDCREEFEQMLASQGAAPASADPAPSAESCARQARGCQARVHQARGCQAHACQALRRRPQGTGRCSLAPPRSSSPPPSRLPASPPPPPRPRTTARRRTSPRRPRPPRPLRATAPPAAPPPHLRAPSRSASPSRSSRSARSPSRACATSPRSRRRTLP